MAVSGSTAGRAALSSLLLAASMATASAQTPDPRRPLTQLLVQQWTDEQGLPSNSVQAVAQAADGYVWIGTEEGLARFDGRRFTLFDRRTTPALPAVYVRALLSMPDSSTWAGTDGGGLVHMRNGRFSITNRTSGLSSDQVVTLARARSGGIWVGTVGGGLNHVVAGSVRAYGRSAGLPHDNVNAILEDTDGTVWLGTPGGLARLRGSRITVHAESLPGRDVLALLRLRDGRIAVGTNGGLALMRNGRIEEGSRLLPGVHVVSLLEDSRGTLWVGTHGSGVLRLVAGRHVSAFSTVSTLRDGIVRALHEDRRGAIWVSTVGSGVHRIREPLVTVIGEAEGLPADIVLALMQDRSGAMRIGTAGGGLAHLRDGTIRTTSSAQGLSHDVILSMAEDRDGSLWVGTPRGLNRLRDGRVERFGVKDGLAGPGILITFVDGGGVLWLGTNGDGLQRWQPGPRTTFRRADGLPSDVITAIAEPRRGELWIGTRHGTARLRQGRVEPGPAALDALEIAAFHVDSSGTLWIGTIGAGLARLRDGRVDRVTTDDGLADDGVNSVLEDGIGGLWLSGPKGVARYAKADVERYMDAQPRTGRLGPRVFGPSDGMRTRETNGGVHPSAWRAADGRLWYPTVRGAAVFDPRRAVGRTAAPLIVVEGLTVDDSSVVVERTMQLRPGSSTLHFAFTAMEFDQPGRVHFRYLLQGFDTTWTEAGTNRDARYTNVPPGTYTFRVAARASDGAWEDGEASVVLTVAPHLYERTLFRVLAALLVLLALAALATAIHRRRLRQHVAREQELLALVADRTLAEARFRELFENATDAVFTTDVAGHITSGNRRFAELSGFPPEALDGRSIHTLITVATTDGDGRSEGGQPDAAWHVPKVAAAAELVRADGARVPVELSTRRVEVHGRVEGIQGIARDVTERRQVEQRMIQAQRMEALGQFAGGVAHDFNNVIVAITAYSELLLDELPAEGPARADVAEIQQAAQRAARLTRQLLAFSRQQVLQPRVLTLNDVVTGLEQMLRRLLREDIAMELVLSPRAGTVTADHGQLEQVLLNLIVNARDAMPEGGRITVETSLVTVDQPVIAAHGSPMRPGRYATLAVRDTGSGMPAEVQARIFEPFFTTKALGSGTGLGLATVLGIVEQSGGCITCESVPGTGTMFRIYLPSAAEAAEKLRPAADAGQQTGTETVLVVEDDTAVRRTTCRILERRGYTVIEAVNGAEALEYCSQPGRVLDIVVTDMIMPVMNGYELAAQLRVLFPQLPVLLMSGYTKDAAIRRDVLDGVSGFIEKPFTSDALTSRIRDLLDQPGSSRFSRADA